MSSRGGRGGRGRGARVELPRGFLAQARRAANVVRQTLEDSAAVSGRRGPVRVDSDSLHKQLCQWDPSIRRKSSALVNSWIDRSLEIIETERTEKEALQKRSKPAQLDFLSDDSGSEDDSDDSDDSDLDISDEIDSGSSDDSEELEGGDILQGFAEPPPVVKPTTPPAPPPSSLVPPSSVLATTIQKAVSSLTPTRIPGSPLVTTPIGHVNLPSEQQQQPAAPQTPSSSSSSSSSSSATGGKTPQETPAKGTTRRQRREEAKRNRKGVKVVSKGERPKRQRLVDEAGNEDDEAHKAYPADIPSQRFKDLGGIDQTVQQIRELIEYPLRHPELYTHLGTEPPRGVLLHGPPGCGKTLLAHAIAGEAGVPFYKVAATEIVGGMSGESEQRIRDLFSAAAENAPSLIFLDEIDAILPKRETAQREMEKRIVSQLGACMDSLTLEATGGKTVMVIGATNRPESLDSSMRRMGRFDREIPLTVPDLEAREGILRVLAQKLRLHGEFNFFALAKDTPGYVGADLAALTKEAAIIAVRRIFKHLEDTPVAASSSSSSKTVDDDDDDESDNDDDTDGGNAGAASSSSKDSGEDVHVNVDGDESDSLSSQTAEQPEPLSENLLAKNDPLTTEQMDSLYITMSDFQQALSKVQPSAKREGFATAPNVTWDDIGALETVRHELYRSISAPIRHPHRFRAYGVPMAAGVLMFGPPGCGKTMLAKAIANEASANFISVKGPELLNKYVGDSERAVRSVFARAQSSSPCVVFFDELDALAPKRSGESGGSQAAERVVNQLLTEMDGLDERKDVFVIGATNRPDIIDTALLRPGRLDKKLYVPLPSPEERVAILRTVTRKMPLHAEIDLEAIAADCHRFSGADLAALAREAAIFALEEEGFDIEDPPEPCIYQRHFVTVLPKLVPSVSVADERMYQQLSRKRVKEDGKADYSFVPE